MKFVNIGDAKLDASQTGQTRLRELCDRFGFKHGCYAHVDLNRQVVHGFTTFPREWIEYYIKNRLFLTDPVINYATNAIAPTDCAKFASQPKYAQLFKAAKRFKIGCQAIAIPTISPLGDRGLLTLTSSLPLKRWKSDIPPMLPRLRHKAQLLHLLSLEVIDTSIDFSTDSLTPDERQLILMLSTGVPRSIISNQTTHTPRMVDILLDSIMTKLKSRTIEQAVCRAIRTGTLRCAGANANLVSAETLDGND